MNEFFPYLQWTWPSIWAVFQVLWVIVGVGTVLRMFGRHISAVLNHDPVVGMFVLATLAPLTLVWPILIVANHLPYLRKRA